ncbi:MAG: RluA family pseudouridine synthase [Burkholderiales bacterium]|nr:RluA family pseudouridine synthase [Burkholderiales bacterium]
MKDLSKVSVKLEEIGPETSGQRVDNFLLRLCKGVPKSHIYRILRSGEVRVNSGRVDATYRLQEGDRVRIPPLRLGAKAAAPKPPKPIDLPLLYEDEGLIAANKPAGLAVHGGSGISHGVIEQLRAARPGAKFLELVHRLDRDTSGLLLLAKKRSVLTAMHELIRTGQMDKRYLVLVQGRWPAGKQHVKLKLQRYVTGAGERRVSVDDEGREAHTVFELVRACGGYSLLQAQLKTGRTHQIRVHLAHLGFPIVGDDKYGDFELNKRLAKQGMRRMFLHAWKLAFVHPASGERLRLEAPLPTELETFLDSCESERAQPAGGNRA